MTAIGGRAMPEAADAPPEKSFIGFRNVWNIRNTSLYAVKTATGVRGSTSTLRAQVSKHQQSCVNNTKTFPRRTAVLPAKGKRLYRFGYIEENPGCGVFCTKKLREAEIDSGLRVEKLEPTAS